MTLDMPLWTFPCLVKVRHGQFAQIMELEAKRDDIGTPPFFRKRKFVPRPLRHINTCFPKSLKR